MYRSIVVPLDGSVFAESALPYAAALAERTGAAIRLVLVHNPFPQTAPPAISAEHRLRWESDNRARESAYLEDARARIALPVDGPVSEVLLEGPVTSTLEEYVESEDVGLVVMTTHGRAGFQRAWLGSVADHLIRHVTVPILLIRPSNGEVQFDPDLPEPPLDRILVPVDGSDVGEAGLDAALRMLRPGSGQITLLRVVAPPYAMTSPYIPHAAELDREELQHRMEEAESYLEKFVAARKEEGVELTARVIQDYHPAHGILRFAADEPVDLIAMGTRGRHAVSRVLLGSTSDKVIRGAMIPVLAVKH
jgi:nucleotide-binding universal stress UspA family protein